MKRKNLSYVFFLIISFLSFFGLSYAQTPADWKQLHGDVNFYVTNDMGRNGYYDQKSIAELMGNMAETVKPECVFALGDIHHFEGVASVQDPLWTTNFENIYSHPELMLPWYPILGNHEYRGSTQAVLEYSKVSRRWEMPSRYYSKVFSHGDVSIRFILLDTSPLISKYRAKSEVYPDACLQDAKVQLEWLENELKNSKEQWIVVMGHHPIYAQTPKSKSEREDMQKSVDSILRKYNVDLYVCGHIHNFQHLRVPGSNIDYVVNSAASLSRKVSETEGTQFCSSEPGFSIITLRSNEMDLHMIDKYGNVIYTVKRVK